VVFQHYRFLGVDVIIISLNTRPSVPGPEYFDDVWK
jgi:hypothetical protein